MTEVVNCPMMESNQALQAALELSMLNLNNTSCSQASPDPPLGLFEDEALLAAKKSQNITQCVAVPSSEHVAEIVGRQGCKIKALRAKTNTYIKTPARGEDPVFVITGRPEDVAAAKREIVTAAGHFTQIRAARRGSTNSPPSAFGSPAEENKVTIYVRVPYRVVGLVVGPKGATVKRIQQITNTYIVTPSRDKEPCFEVTGAPENVDRAKQEIESYIAMRTGGSIDSDVESDYQSLLSPMVDAVFSPGSHLALKADPSGSRRFQFPLLGRPAGSAPDAPMSAVEGSFDAFNGCAPWSMERPPHRISPLSNAVFGPAETEMVAVPLSAPATSERVFDFGSMHDTLAALKLQPPSPTESCGSNSSEGTAVTSPKQSPKLPLRSSAGTCFSCRENEVVAALVPCGHNLFCYPCARHIAFYQGSCPVCSTQVTTMLRIYN